LAILEETFFQPQKYTSFYYLVFAGQKFIEYFESKLVIVVDRHHHVDGQILVIIAALLDLS